MQYRKHEHCVESPLSTLKKRSLLRISPSHARTGIRQIHNEREDVKVGGDCTAPGLADDGWVAVNRHDLSVVARGYSCVIADVRSDVEHRPWAEFGQDLLHEGCLGREGGSAGRRRSCVVRPSRLTPLGRNASQEPA